MFGTLESELGPLSDAARLLIAVLEMIPLSRHLAPSRGWLGRPSKDRQALAGAFIAKAVYGLQTTRQLIERLQVDRQLRLVCGWNSARSIPHEATFSRVFGEFARTELPQRLHEALILKTQRDRLIGHIARDATAIEARERFPETPDSQNQGKRKRRPKRRKASERGTRLERQTRQTLAQQLAELPQQCSIGVKKSSKGHPQYWRGYKLHLDVADGQIPITALLTGASVHDSQAAIPLMTLTSQRVTYLYDLMDAAYDAAAIRNQSLALGHKPITDRVKHYYKTGVTKVPLRKNSRSFKRVTEKELRAPEMTWAERDRFAERTMVERVYSRLKDEFGGRSVRVRGAKKVMAHLMFGVVALTVDQLLNLTG
ncbi:MAG: transposase [Acidobacteriota bacterium]|nr:transposase [Acidobacteriota bacterium]